MGSSGINRVHGESPHNQVAMRVLTLLFVLACLFCLIEGHSKAQKKKLKKNLRMFRNLKKRAKAMEETLNGITDTLIAANKTASAATRHTSVGGQVADDLTLVDATFTNTQCGAFTLTSWSTTLNYFAADGGADTAPDPFISGTFTPRINGWYRICSFSRFRNTGNSNDVTVMVSGSVVAAYGNADQSDWRTTGVCFDAYLTTTQTVTVQHRSGGSNDCIQSTSWPYNKFTVHNTGNNA